MNSNLVQIIYASKPFGYDDATLRNILHKARKHNARDAVTGALICRRDIYLQLLEGPTESVQAAFERISSDDRHLEIRTLVSEPITHRSFGDWAMLHDPAKTLIWSEAEISAGIIDRLAPSDFKAAFEALAQHATK
jgi:hypothetical protein